jgi:leader peptidase (prepilin peptidase)/N-methyltransferase
VTPEVIFAALFGLLFGSFLNVCIYRLPRDLSVVWPGSRCLACGHSIAPWDNIPVLGYVLLGGRCRHCRSAIYWRYPLVEALTAICFGAGVWFWGPTAQAGKFALFSFLLLGMIFADLETRLLPDEFTKGGLILGLLLSLFVPMKMGMMAVFLPQSWSRFFSLADAAVGAAFLSGAFWSLGYVFSKVRHKEGLGFGDVKMVAMIGAFQGVAPALMTAFIGCIGGSVIGLSYIYLAKKDFSTYEVPFGTFLGVAALAVAFWVG